LSSSSCIVILPEMSREPGLEGLDGHILLSKEDAEAVYRDSGPEARRILEAAVAFRRRRREAKAMLAFGFSEADLDIFCYHPASWAAAYGASVRGRDRGADKGTKPEPGEVPPKPREPEPKSGGATPKPGEPLPKSKEPEPRSGGTTPKPEEPLPKLESGETRPPVVVPVTAASLLAFATPLVPEKAGPPLPRCVPASEVAKPTPPPKPPAVRRFYMTGLRGKANEPMLEGTLMAKFPQWDFRAYLDKPGDYGFVHVSGMAGTDVDRFLREASTLVVLGGRLRFEVATSRGAGK